MVLLLDTSFLFALFAAFFFTSADLFARAGLHRGVDTFVGGTIVLSTKFIFLLTIVQLLDVSFPKIGIHYLWILLGGMCNPGLFLIFFMNGILRIGVSRAAPIKGTAPLFGAILAILFLGEQPAWYHLFGVIFVTFGIILISMGKDEEGWKRKDAIWPILAAISSGVGSIFWKHGLAGFEEVAPASFVGVFAALTIVLSYTLIRSKNKFSLRPPPAFVSFLLCGLTAGAGILLLASALKSGEIYRVLPIVEISPLLTVLFSVVFLRGSEIITWRTPVGSFFMVGGAILVTLRFGVQ